MTSYESMRAASLESRGEGAIRSPMFGVCFKDRAARLRMWSARFLFSQAVMLPISSSVTLLFAVCLLHGHHAAESPVGMAIFNASSSDIFNASDTIQSLVGALADRLDCQHYGVKPADCVTCLTAERIMKLLEIQDDQRSLTSTEITDIATVLLHHILYFPTLCSTHPQGCRDYAVCRDEVLQLMHQSGGPLYSLEYVLRELKGVLEPVPSTECFSAGTILKELHSVPHDYHEKLGQAITNVMHHVFQGHCIDVDESAADFIDDIFHTYGKECFSVIDAEGIKRILKDLQNGQDSHNHHSHDHGNHDDHHHDHHHSHDDHHHHHEDCENNASGLLIHPHTHRDNYDAYKDLDNRRATGNTSDDDHKHVNIRSGEYWDYLDYSYALSMPTAFIPNEGDNKTSLDKHHLDTVKNISNVTYSRNGNESDSEQSRDEFVTSFASNYTRNQSAEAEQPVQNGETAQEQQNLNESVLVHNSASVASSMRSEFFHQEDGRRDNSILFGQTGLQELQTGSENDDATIQRSDASASHYHTNLAEKCLSVEELMEKFGHSPNGSLTKLQFVELCPALVQQTVSGVCHKKVVKQQRVPSAWELYGYSTLAVFIISLTSLAGVVLLPILAKQAYYYVMAGCIGLAFSTLAGDALLHLMPQALGVHNHSEEDHSHDHEAGFGDPTFVKQLAVFIAVYLLYLFEAVMCAFSKSSHSHAHRPSGHGHSHIPDTLPKELTLVSIKVKSDSNTALAMSPERSSSLDTEIAEIEVSRPGSHKLLSAPTLWGMSTVAVLIILGDSIHNFSDGLAIGAAFSSGIRSGLSTSVAVFCHELPHEFGDFVILLSSGLSFPKALWLNFLSGLTCLIGLYVGIQVGVNETARMWILAVTAGIFLYVALTEMLPELKEQKKGDPLKMLIVKNIGVLAGITIMVLISMYEHKFTF